MADELEDLRAELARVDDALLAKIAERRALVAKIASCKQRQALPPFAAAAEAARDARVQRGAAVHRLPSELVAAVLQPLFDDALRAQCALGALAVAERAVPVYVAPKLAAIGGGRFVEALDSVGVSRVSDPESAWVLQLPSEPPPALAADLRGHARVTLSAPDPFRARVDLEILVGDGAEIAPLFEALGAAVTLRYPPANTT